MRRVRGIDDGRMMRGKGTEVGRRNEGDEEQELEI